MKARFKHYNISGSFTVTAVLLIAVFPMLLLGQSVNDNSPGKINGISFFPPGEAILNLGMITSVKETNARWIAFVPEVVLDRETLQLRPDEANPWWGKTIIGITKSIELANQADLKVMLKPHVELSAPLPVVSKSFFDFSFWRNKKGVISEKDKTNGASWRGDFTARDVINWTIWESSYESYILELAELAQRMDVAIFCVGTELRESARLRPDYWRQLIKKVRKVYSGQVVYSANWDEYHLVPFWDALDYIGINGYFPISQLATPTVNETVVNWQPILQKLQECSDQYQKQILITEFGYRNVSYAALEPWTHDNDRDDRANDLAQVNLYEAFFRTFQQQSFVAGSFLWQWLYKEVTVGNTDFTPQGKPALKVVKRWYSKK